MASETDLLLGPPQPKALPLANLVEASRCAIALRRQNDFRNLPLWIEEHVMMKEHYCDEEDEEDIVEEVATQCFGDMEFRGATRSSRAKFLRLSDESEVETIYNMMVKGWKIERPRLLISVIGGKKNFNLDFDTKQYLNAGLSKIAQTEGTWLITEGTFSGVAKYVGDALQGCSKSCIGIPYWGGITNHDELEFKDDGKYIYHVGSWLTDVGVYLDNNHSHFLLVDDGNKENWGVEIEFRRQIERQIMTGSGERIPAVLLVMEGDISTLSQISESVAGDMPVPVVLVKSSGGAAELLCYALTLDKEIGIPTDPTADVLAGLAFQIKKVFPELEDDAERIEVVYRTIQNIMTCKEMIIDSTHTSKGSDIGDAILAALLNDKDTSTFRQLQLTLTWGRADLAKEIIYSEKRHELTPDELHWLMIQALATDNPLFVALFVESGVTMKYFLTNEVLEFLYGYRSYNNYSPIGWELSEKAYYPCNINGPHGKIYEYLCRIGRYDVQKVSVRRGSIEDIMNELCENLVKIGNEKFIEDLNTLSEDAIDTEDKRRRTFQYPFRELFFWAVLNNMKDMALFLWQFEEQPMTKALIASEVTHELHKRRKNVEHLEKSLADLNIVFQEQAVKVLDHCYKEDEDKSTQLILSIFHQFPSVNALTLAVNAGNKVFVSHSSVQVLLNDIWTGNMKMRDVNLSEIILATFLPWRIKNFEFRTEEEILKMAKKGETKEETEDNSEIGLVSNQRDTFHQPKFVGTQLPLYKKFYQYYWYTPVVKFITHVIFYFIFLAIFAHFAMMEKSDANDNPLPPKGNEYLLAITVFAYGIAEIYQVMQVDAPTFKARMKDWASSRLNILDATIIISFFISLGFRFSPESVKLGHLLYAIDCGIWILRLLNVFYINPTLGPYIVSICKMVKDVVTFMGVLLIILLSYGVTSAAILYPMNSASIDMIKNPIWQPYFKIYGLNLVDREPSDNTTTRFGSDHRTDYDETVVWILTGLYLLLVNILLLNLLIAVMNNTYNAVQENSSQVWKYQRYNLIMEYTNRHPLPPPFSLIGHFYLVIVWCMDCISGKTTQQYSGFKTDLSKQEKDILLEFECNCLTQLSRKRGVVVKKTFEDVSIHMREEMENVKMYVSSMEVKLAVENMERVKRKKVKDLENKRRLSLAAQSFLRVDNNAKKEEEASSQ